MEFIDHTGHIFSLPSYNEYPVGYEYDTNDYIFWINNEYTGRLSTETFYMKPIRPLLYNATINIESCKYSNIEYNGESKVPYKNPVTNEVETKTIENKLNIKESKKQIIDVHVSVDSKYYNLVASKQIQDLVSSNKSMSEYITIDSEKDSKKFLEMSDIDILDDLEDGDKHFAMIPFYVICNCDEEGSWMTNVMIHVKYSDETEEWCPITVGGEYYGESEELVINGKNMGIDLPKDILKAVYQNSFYNEYPDSTIYNDKIKELLISYNHIKMEVGNFRSVIDSLKWFGYGEHITISKLLQTDNQFLNQYIRDYFNVNGDILYSFNTFRNSTMVALTIPENVETSDRDPQDFSKEWFIGENKPILEDLFHKVIEKRYDEKDIIFYKPYYDYIFDELGLKLACLKYYYEKFFLPIHLSVHSATIAHKVFANDIKLIQTTEVKTANPPILIADPNITVEFPVEKIRYIYNHKLYVDENYNSFSTTYDVASNTDSLAYWINDVCVDVPIKFRSTEMEQYYTCVLILRKNGKQIYESHFDFCQSQILDENGNEKIVNEYLKFVIVPKIINSNFNINYWLNKDYQICLLVNGNWYTYDFVMKLPEFQLNFGKLVYKYNISENYTQQYELKETDAEYVSPDDPNWYEGINIRNDKVAFVNLFKQINKITNTGVEFNSFMYVPSLVEVNDINFLPNLHKRIQWTKKELEDETNKWHASQIQISDIKFPLPSDGDCYAYGDIINGYYRLSVEETSQIKNLKVLYRGFLNWHDYIKYLSETKKLDIEDPNYKENLDKLVNSLGVVYDCEIEYDFVNNTIRYKYPEYNTGNLADWYGIDENENITYGKIGPRKEFNWIYYSEPVIDEETGEVIGEKIDPEKQPNSNLNYIVEENGQHIHYKLVQYVTTNAVFNYIRSNSTFGTFDLSLKNEIGNDIINNGYFGLAIHLIGELQNGYTFEKIKYGEPPIRDVEEDTGDYCPFSELCNDCCAGNCKYRRPIPSDRPKDDDGKYILTDEFNRSIDNLYSIGEIDRQKTYSDIVLNSISKLIEKYKESPIIVDNNKYLNRIHMYHLYNENGDMVRYIDDSTYPDILRGMPNCNKKNMTYMNHVKGNPLTPNKEFFFQDLYKQPDELISFYRQFFWDNGDAKLIYPVENYFDFDTYLMHDKDYWYIVFISTMTIDNILDNKDLIAKKTIDYDSYIITDNYYHLTSGAYLGISDNFVYIKVYNDNGNYTFEKLTKDIEYKNSVIKATVKQYMNVQSIYYIYNNVTKEYILEDNEIEKDRYKAYWDYVNNEWIHREYPKVEAQNISIDPNIKTYIYPVYYDVKINDHEYEEVANFDTEAEALGYVKKWKSTQKIQAEQYIDNLVKEESKYYTIKSSYNNVSRVNEYRVYRINDDNKLENVFEESSKNYFDSNEEAEKAIENILAGYRSRYEIVDESTTVFIYNLYNGETGQMLFENEKYFTPLKADNYGKVMTNKYTLKWQRSANQFLINRMYFVDTEGINQFDNDDLIVASIDNVNFPYIFETGSKWKFSPMSLGMLESTNVESNTNSAIVSIGKGNKTYNRGYYNVDVRYSVDSFNQHQYIKKARILVK